MSVSSTAGHRPVSGGEQLPDADQIVASCCGEAGAEAYQEATLGENPREVVGYGVSPVEKRAQEVHVSEVVSPQPEPALEPAWRRIPSSPTTSCLFQT